MIRQNPPAAVLFAASLLSGTAFAQATPPTPIQQHFRAIYQELVETNTTNSTGSCTTAVKAMAARLKAGGYSDAEMQFITPPDGPTKGNLVVRLKGSGASKPLLLLAHVDVVEAKRADWVRDPFKLTEEKGVFYARGSSDDKAMAAVFVENMIRYKQEKLAAKRDIILALTCDEEILPSKFNGVDYLLRHHRPLIDAELALNEGGSGYLDKNEKPVRLSIQVGERITQNYQLEVTNPGGHSARPPRENAIYRLSRGLARLDTFDFPFTLSPVTSAFFAQMAQIEQGQTAADMKAILRTPPDREAMERLYAISPEYNSSVRTTCVTTMVDAGHAANALPQRARANVNCRILPGDPVDGVRATLVRVLADDKISVTPVGEPDLSPPPPLTPSIMEPVKAVTAEMWPGVPVVPTMLVATSDGRYLNNAGIWTYGVNGMFVGVEGSGAHGLDEHIRVKSLYDGLEFLYRVGKRIAQQ